MTTSNELHGLLKEALRTLPVDVAKVLTLRYGLEDSRKQSFARIAKALQTTSAFVIQKELQGVRRLRRPNICAPFFDALNRMDAFLWSQISRKISDAGSLVPKSDTYDRVLESLPGEISLAIRCRYATLGKWLECNALETDSYWYRSQYSPEMVNQALERLSRIWNEQTPPIPISILVRQLQVDASLLQFLFALSSLSVGLYTGYAAVRPLSSSALRAIRLHLLLVYQYPRTAIKPKQIAQAYNDLYHDDQMNPNMAVEVMLERPISFQESDAHAWSGIGSQEEHAGYASTDDVAHDDAGAPSGSNRANAPYVFERPWSETTAVDILREILDIKGLASRQSIVRSFMARTDSRYQAVTAATHLGLDEAFLEPAPRVFGLRKEFQNLDPVMSWTEFLLNKSASQYFIRDRYAGEPLNTYPYWTPAMEQHWCFWAEANSELKLTRSPRGDSEQGFYRRLFQSLLYVAEPTLWPVSNALKAEWTFKKECISHYHFADPLPERLWQRRITLQDLFSLTLHAKRLGYANWVRASLILDMGPHSPHAAGALSLLIALEIITPTDHWQKRHETGPLMDHALHIMEKEIRKKGFVHWLDEAGVYFKGRLREGVVGMDLGWVRFEHIREFLEVLEGRAMHEQPSKGPLLRAGSNAEKQTEKHWLPRTPELEQLTLPF